MNLFKDRMAGKDGSWLAAMRRDRCMWRVVQGLLLSVAAPMGWLFLRVLAEPELLLRQELLHSWPLYLYVWCGSLAALMIFARMVGSRERDLEELTIKLHQLSFTDGLTELKNARYFWSRFDEALEQHDRTGEHVALVLIDLDHFKSINDTHGHITGDHVLEGLGRLLAGQVRAGEVAARVGGEEFALLLPAACASHAERAAERVRKALAAYPFKDQHDQPLKVTMSCGVASTSHAPVQSAQKLFERADVCLYKAKHGGRNRTISEKDTSPARSTPPPPAPHSATPARTSGDAVMVMLAGKTLEV